jgi:ferredoxin-NADP reductase
MDYQSVKIKSIVHISHDVLQIVTDKPRNIVFIPGQAVDISINKSGWENENRPFSFTSLPQDEILQFTIKTYPSHKGVTNEFLSLKKDDELILHDIFGTIAYKGEGLFIAGGTGVTPFISIFRFLKSKNEVGNNKLIFANKTKEDIILRHEFEELLGKNFINILSEEETGEYLHGFITEDLIRDNLTDLNKKIYLCAPPRMMILVKKILSDLGIDSKLIILEE